MAGLHGTVTSIDLVGTRLRRITISATELRGQPWTPGQQVRVRTGDPKTGDRGPKRSYSVYAYDGDSIELCIVDHGEDGPGTAWARRIAVGEPVDLSRPEGSFVLRQGAPYHLFAGDETASVPFAAMLRALPAKASVFGVVEVDGPEDRLPLPDSITWAYRAGASAAASESLVAAVRELTLPDEPGIAYLAGEARTIQLVRKHLVKDRNWSKRNVVTKPFWTPGRRGMD
jgi:NADPH-dependent ferric siderophore reductase